MFKKGDLLKPSEYYKNNFPKLIRLGDGIELAEVLEVQPYDQLRLAIVLPVSRSSEKCAKWPERYFIHA